MDRLQSIGQLEWLRNKILARSGEKKVIVHVCMTGCRAHGAAAVKEALEEEIKGQRLGDRVEIRSTGCHGFCAKAPVIAIEPLGIQYQEVAPEDAVDIVAQTLKKNRLIDRMAYQYPVNHQPVFNINQIPFYQKQEKRVLARCGRIDPTEIDHYLFAGGYHALAKTLSNMSPEAVIEEVTAAKLRGRGGAGFPTGIKWKFTRDASGRPKYIVCNADEGDPGAFMDRAVLEGDPHSVLEGMSIGAYAIGANVGYVYIRAEYPLAVVRLLKAIEQAKEYGVLGKNIMGTGFDFDIEVFQGAGAFVCGASTSDTKA